jgi:hypothetical protein
MAIQITQTLSAFTDVPRMWKERNKISEKKKILFIAPPPRPEQFRSREELKRYLQLVRFNI